MVTDPEPAHTFHSAATVPLSNVALDQAPPALHAAAASGDLELVQTLLSKEHANIDERDASGATALLVAAREGRLPVVQLLLASGADAAAATNNASTPLMLAALHGRAEVVALLLAQSPEVVGAINAVNGSSYSALHCAASEGHVEVARLLLDYGADLEVTVDGWRPLHVACSKEHVAVVALLLSRGASVDAVMQDGITALHFVALQCSVELARVLLDAGAGLQTGAGETRMTPLHLAAVRGDLAMCQFLVSRGAQAQAETIAKITPFYTAAERGHLEVAKYLASADTEWKARKSPVHVVAANGFTDVLAFLLAEGVDVEAGDEFGLTALCVAAVRDQVDIVKMLLAAGANVNAKTAESDAYSCLHYCAELNREEVMKLLIASGADIRATTGAGHTPLHVAAIHGHVAIISLLIESSADPFAESGGQVSVPHLAAAAGRLAVLQYLVDNGLARDLDCEADGVTPLSLAAAAGHLEVVAFLLQWQDERGGADDELKLALRADALTCAIEGSHVEIVKLLCEQGRASIDMLATKDTTALHIAAAIGSAEIVAYLLEAQHASVRARIGAGLTPLLYAATAGHARIVEALLAHGASVDEAVEHSSEPELDGTAAVHFAALYAHLNVLETLVAHGANVNARTSQGTGALECARDCDDADAIPAVVAFLQAHGATDLS
ncbi:hypothetical protein PybrP1_003466 [[Pythium] brassicae (nom. inval.)]|nr:hypothetical protein PybrP1_003466 [[Pythium] brassicae (nom. inval.)]